MSSRKRPRRLGILAHGKNPLGQFSPPWLVTPGETNVRQGQECLHLLRLVSQPFGKVAGANESRLTFWP